MGDVDILETIVLILFGAILVLAAAMFLMIMGIPMLVFWVADEGVAKVYETVRSRVRSLRQ